MPVFPGVCVVLKAEMILLESVCNALCYLLLQEVTDLFFWHIHTSKHNDMTINQKFETLMQEKEGRRIWTSYFLHFFRFISSKLEIHVLNKLKSMNLLISDILVSLPNQVVVCEILYFCTFPSTATPAL